MKTYLFLLLLILSSACQKIRYEDFPEHEPLLTVNSFFGTDSLASIQLYASKGIGESTIFEGVEGATVEVWEGGEIVGQLHMQKPGYYQSDTLYPQAEKTYTLKVSASGYPTAEATTSIPTKPLVENIQISRSPASTANQPLRRLKFTLNDPPGQDYYLLKVYIIRSAYGSESPIPYRQPLLMDFQAPIDEFDTPFGQVFTDKTFDGTSLELVADYEIFSDTETYIQISKANEDLYRYYKTYRAHSNYGEQTFSDPQEVYLNIAGGFGIFSGYASMYYKYTPE